MIPGHSTKIAVNRKLPKLAWVARITDSEISAEVGTGVRAVRGGFYEGGWSHCDQPVDLRPDAFYLGSGVIRTDAGVALICPSHTCDAIYVASVGSGATVAANSLALVLARIGLTDFDLGALSKNLRSIVHGLVHYRRLVLEHNDVRLRRYVNAIVHLEDDQIKEQWQTMREPLDAFESYRAFLERVILEAEQTFGASRRLVPLSTGYDSTCCAALAKRLGGGVSFSVDVDRNGLADNGAATGRLLGLEVHEHTRALRPYKEQPVTYNAPGGVERRAILSEDEAAGLVDYYSGLSLGDESLRIPDELLANCALLTGFHGDKVWSLGAATPHIKRGDPSGTGLTELRLRNGYVHIPVPMIGAQAHQHIRAISMSESLEPWRVGGRYDRPIPRRIAEEEGVPRALFGQKKHAIDSIPVNAAKIAPTVLALQMTRYRSALEG